MAASLRKVILTLCILILVSLACSIDDYMRPDDNLPESYTADANTRLTWQAEYEATRLYTTPISNGKIWGILQTPP